MYYPLLTNLLPRDIKAKCKLNITLERKDNKDIKGDINREIASINILDKRAIINFKG